MAHHDPLPPIEVSGAKEIANELYPEKQKGFLHYSTNNAYVVPTKGVGDAGVNHGSICDSNDCNFDNTDAKTVTTITSDILSHDRMLADGGSLSHASNSYNNQELLREEQMVQIATTSHELDLSFLREGELYDREEQQRQLLDIFYRQMDQDALVVDDNNYYDHEQVCENDDAYDEGDKRPQSARSISSHSFTSFGTNSIPSGRSNKEFVIVTGLSGTGKTILVEETLKRPILQRGGYFLIGKLDQLDKSKARAQPTVTTANYAPLGLERPYAPFMMAFSNFVDLVVMNKDVAVAEEVRACVCSKMTPREIDLMLETFPSLSRIIRPNELIHGNDIKSSATDKINGAENQKQLARVVRIFLRSICDPELRPIVLLIDDLQWADKGTLVLLHSLLSERETDRIKGLLLVGTCRHNEVTVEDDVATLLRTLEDEESVSICEIEVSNLSRPACGELFARLLGISHENYTPEVASSMDTLVDIAYEHTEGNAFFFLQFIRILYDDGYLKIEKPKIPTQLSSTQASIFSPHNIVIDDNLSTSDISVVTSTPRNQRNKHQKLLQQSNNWQWNEDAIRRSSLHNDTNLTNDAVSILAHQMKRFPQRVQETIMVASCLGAKFDKQLLVWAMSSTSADQILYNSEFLSRSLELLIEKDMMRINTGSWQYQFCHDKIQQAAISLIQDHELPTFCTNIGRRLLNHAGVSKSENIFLIVNLFSHGLSAGTITDRSELMMVATLALEAGEAATSMSDFGTASSYLSLGISCLRSSFAGIKNGYWKDDRKYEFSLNIFNAAAEVEYCTGNFERMDYLIKEILLNARKLHDKIRSYITMINSLGSRERLLEAIAQGFSLLEVLGERFHASDLKLFLLTDIIKTKRMLKHFDSDFEQLPEMIDKNKIAAMQILNIIFPYCMMLKHPKLPHAIFRMVQLTIKFGITATSATGFAGYGLILCGLGDFRNGNRYGKIALRLLDHFDAKQLTSRVFCMYYGFISNWNTVRKSPIIVCSKTFDRLCLENRTCH